MMVRSWIIPLKFSHFAPDEIFFLWEDLTPRLDRIFEISVLSIRRRNSALYLLETEAQNIYPNVAKAEDAVDPRRQGRSRSSLLRALDNKGGAVSSAFPEGK